MMVIIQIQILILILHRAGTETRFPRKPIVERIVAQDREFPIVHRDKTILAQLVKHRLRQTMGTEDDEFTARLEGTGHVLEKARTDRAIDVTGEWANRQREGAHEQWSSIARPGGFGNRQERSLPTRHPRRSTLPINRGRALRISAPAR